VQRHAARPRPDEEALTAEIVALAGAYGRYGYRRITALLRRAGWRVNAKRVERIWRREGLKVPRKQPKRGRLWLNDGSCVRLRPERPNHVWAYDFVQDRTRDGKVLRMLVVVDEFTRECLAIRVERRLGSDEVLEVLAGLFVARGAPEHVRSDNGPEFAATAERAWLARLGVGALFIEPGSPWENGYCESLNGSSGTSCSTGALPLAAGGPGADRGLAPALQHGAVRTPRSGTGPPRARGRPRGRHGHR
jgi:transposase InsO family protein